MKAQPKFHVFACICILILGCNIKPANTSPNLGGPNGTISWTATDKDHPEPGINQGSIYHLGTTFVVWTDSPRGGGGSSSSNSQEVKCQGNLQTEGGQRVEFRCETKDAKKWSATINKVDYDLADGNLFLVRAEGNQIQVKQLKRKLEPLTFDRERLQALAKSDAEIAAFFKREMKPK
jgi:hypothetical protein